MGSWTALFGGTNIAPAIPGFLQLNISANTQLGWPIEANATSPIAAPIIEVNASAPALTVQLADARQVSDGSALLFNNVGVNTFTVLDAQGNTLAAIASGQVWQLYLADNSTLQGTWRVFQFGAGVSNANASALAGLGLKAISTTLNEHIVINQQVTNYNIQTSDRAACVEWAGGSGGIFTGPSPAIVGSDWFCYIKNAGTGILTFVPPSGTIDGGPNKSFNPNDSAIIITDGTNFISLGFGQSVASSFNFVQIAVTGGNLVLSGAQLNRISYRFTGVLTANQTITVPASIQQYWVDNETTGAFTLTVTAGSGSVNVGQGQRTILYCDGVNIVNAVSGGAAPTFGDGTAAAPSISFTSDLTLGLYKAGADVLGFATAGVARGSINAAGAWVINAPNSGTQALTVNGVANAYTANITGSSTNGQSFGLAVVAGTTAIDIAITVENHAANTTFFQIFGDGHGTLGPGPVISWTVAGNVTIQQPTTGTSLTVVPLSGVVPVAIAGVIGGQYGIQINNVDTVDGRASITYISARGVGQQWSAGLGPDGGGLYFGIRDNTRGAIPFEIATTGAFTMAVPGSAATTLTIQSLDGSASIIAGINGGAKNPRLVVSHTDATSLTDLNFTAGTGAIGTISVGGITAISLGSARQVTMGSTSGVTLTVNGVANQYAAEFFAGVNTAAQRTVHIRGSSAAGFSGGLFVEAGTNASDDCIYFRSQSGAINFMEILGDGSGFLGYNGTNQVLNWTAAGVLTAKVSGTTILSVNGTASPSIQGYGPVAGVLVDMTPDKGSWVTTLSGLTWTNPTGTLNWERQGTQVTIWCDANIVAAATAGGTISASGVPVSIRPSSSRACVCSALEDSGISPLLGVAVVGSGGTIVITLANSRAGANPQEISTNNNFNGTSTTGILATWSITYSL